MSDFKSWAMARARKLLPLHSTHWVSGVMTEQGAVFLDVCTEGLRPGYWESFQALMPEDPIGPRMFASPGQSMLVSREEFPASIRDLAASYGVKNTILGMAADTSTSTFSVVCWYRTDGTEPFTEGERRLHELLLPHWMECLNLHRVTRVLRDDLHTVALPDSLVALVDSSGLLHYAQLGFGDAITEEFSGWRGTKLPLPLLASLAADAAGYTGRLLDATWRALPQGLWAVHVSRHRTATASALSRARETELRLLNASLDERERELELTQRVLRDRERREVMAEERQRLLRELHDGVGAHLVGLRGLLRVGATVTDDMSTALEGALDEMRLAVDSMATTDVGLMDRLAMLRWRMQPRLEAAGISLSWSVPDVEPAALACRALGSTGALQVQRLLLEAFTNILKHSQASHVEVMLECAGDGAIGWKLRLRDDGIGLRREQAQQPGAASGLGLANMARRAEAIGATLELTSPIPVLRGAEGSTPRNRPGTEISLVWPKRSK